MDDFDLPPLGWDAPEVPGDWFMHASTAQEFYRCSPLMSHVLESLPTDRVVTALRNSNLRELDVSVTDLIGVPDLRAARKMCDVTRADLCFFAEGASEDELEALEMGLLVPSLRGALNLCNAFGWPLGAIFRNNEAHWHRRTYLAQQIKRGGVGQ